MRYVYFTKTLNKLTVAELVAFCKEVGLDGVDLAVRPGYPVTPTTPARRCRRRPRHSATPNSSSGS